MLIAVQFFSGVSGSSWLAGKDSDRPSPKRNGGENGADGTVAQETSQALSRPLRPDSKAAGHQAQEDAQRASAWYPWDNWPINSPPMSFHRILVDCQTVLLISVGIDAKVQVFFGSYVFIGRSQLAI